MKAIDYQKVFSNLCHIKALSRDNKFDEIVQHIILNVLYRKSDEIIANADDIVEKISEVYGVNIRQTIITSNTDKLLSAGKIEKTAKRGLFLPIHISEKIGKNIENTRKIDDKIKSDWIGELKSIHIDKTDDELDVLWKGLQMYLARIFEQHGVQTINLLDPQNKPKEVEVGSNFIVKQIAENLGGFVSVQILTDAINSFFNSADKERIDYLAQLADASFTSYALTTDQQTTRFLNDEFRHFDLFLDTNFIFGILDLHKNTEDTAAKEILNEVRKNQLPFQLHYHPETLDEFKRAFDFRANLIREINWTKETSRLALAEGDLSPIERSYHERNVHEEIDPRVFLEKYDHVSKILKDLGLYEYVPFQNIKRDDEELVDIEADIQSYEEFYNNIPSRKRQIASYHKFKHDIMVLRDVRKLNLKKTRFLESNAFFISSDYILAKFERHKYVKRYEIEYVVSPSIFLQLIRPFITSDYASNRRFVDTFAIPEFRAFDIDYTNAKSTALQIINDQFHGATYETKAEIMRSEVLLKKIELSKENQEAQVKLIEEFVAKQNAILAEQNIVATEKINKLSNDVIGLSEREKRLTKQNAELSKGIEGYDIREKALQSELQRTKDELQRKTQEQEFQQELSQWEDDRSLYATNKLEEKMRQYKTDLCYMIKTFWWTLIVVIVAPVILDADISHFPKWTRIFITTFAYLAVFVFFCWRVYWVKDKDKERIRNGFKWAKTFGIKRYKTATVENHKSEFEREFENQKTKPTLM